MSEDITTLLKQVDAFQDSGCDVEAIFCDLLSPTAKLLGVLWEDDRCSFADVTVGLCRLQQIVYEFSERECPSDGVANEKNALFALTPGDQHSFGLVLVGEFFRRAGWRTTNAPNATEATLVNMVSSESFDLIGFSMADEKWLATLPNVIATLRRVSINPNVRIIVGGRVFSENPDRVAQVGADATAVDARQAVRHAALLVGDNQPSRLMK